MSNDFVYNMSEINEEEIVKGWEEINEEEADYIPGYDDGEWDPIMGDSEDWVETDDDWAADYYGEEEFA